LGLVEMHQHQSGHPWIYGKYDSTISPRSHLLPTATFIRNRNVVSLKDARAMAVYRDLSLRCCWPPPIAGHQSGAQAFGRTLLLHTPG